MSGRASWYCCTRGYGSGDFVAAAGPALRKALGPDWRGSVIYVNGIRVRVVDWCGCSRGKPSEKVIDLHPGLFSQLAPLSRGVVKVEIHW